MWDWLNILIVEDVEITLNSMRRYLTTRYPGARVDTATTVADAFRRLEWARLNNLTYTIFVLDFKLPKAPGENPEIDTTLRKQVLESSTRDAVVFHITAYQDDEGILQFLVDVQSIEKARPIVIDKLKSTWTDELYDLIARKLHGDRIRARLLRLFGDPRAAERPLYFEDPSRPTGDGTLTLQFRDLFQDIADHWKSLDDTLKTRIREVLVVDEKADPVYVSLI
ncbi:MAG TPA: hypothetical protein VD866_21815 [Urbifossiella sp.]|nr:hypothetical protein [Urbifossiella sp.]